MTNPYGGPPSGPQPQQPYGQQPHPQSGPQPQQQYPQSGPMPQQGAPAPYGQAPYGQAPYGQAPYGAPGGYGQPNPNDYANWGQRFLGALIDGGIPGLIAGLVGGIVGGATASMAASGDPSSAMTAATISGVVSIVLWVALIAFQIWNMCYRRGTTGQTLGQQALKIKTISEETGQPLGFGNAFLRHICHFLDGIACSIGYLWPLWDDKRQTFADKIIRSVVVPASTAVPQAPGQSGYPQPGYPQAGYPQQGGYPQPGGGYPQQGGYPPQTGGHPQQGYGQPPQQW